MFKKFNSVIGVMVLSIFAVQTAQAHFVWIAKHTKSGEIRVFFGEEPSPDQKIFLKGISSIKLWSVNEGKLIDTAFQPKDDGDDGWLVAQADATKELFGDVEYGVFSRGESSMFLHYSAKYAALVGGQKQTAKSAKHLPLDIQAAVTSQKVDLKVLFERKKVKGLELVIIDPNGNVTEAKTDSNGAFAFDSQPGRYLIRAKQVVKKAGEQGGKKYGEKRFYCTLTLDVTDKKSIASKSLKVDDTKTKVGSQNSDKLSKKATDEKAADEKAAKGQSFPDIPEGLTSFGGAIANGKMYIYGGHTGKPHSYYESGQNKTLYELDLQHPREWKSVGEGLGLQGLAMVAYQGKIYRLGGFHAHNKEGEDQDLRSVAEFAVFDFKAKKWKQLQPMPVGRSSFDAVVKGSAIYVIGGWTMKGTDGKSWCESALVYDFADDKPTWKEIAKPAFKRRALSVGFQGKKIVAIGGMQQVGGPSTKVDLYDTAKQTWAEGPALPGKNPMEGFGSSCFNVGGRLVVSTYSGKVYRLSQDFKKWEAITELEEGRFFHRLLPLDQQRFVLVGGASMETGKFYELEVLSKD